MKSLTFVEIDVDYCALTYGTAPCVATTTGGSPTGTRKCFNTLATCQDRDNFDNDPVTLRFAMPTAYLAESGIEAFACLESVSFTPGRVSLGKDLGERASLRVTARDFRWSDTGEGFDKYLADRSYDPFTQGTFWGKFRARQPYLRGRAIRVIRGTLGQTLGQMTTRHYVIESFTGPGPDGRYSIVAKDVLKLADGDRAKAPALSQGYLDSGIGSGASSATLAPTGIGDAEYPSSGYAAIGGKEVVSFTRSGDTLTLTRGQYNTDAVSHSASDRVQLCLEYTSDDVADIIADLLENYAAVPSSYIPLATWQAETGAYLRTLYSALIAEPTSVRDLLAELIEQAALALWWDDSSQLLKLQVLRAISTDAAVFGDAQIMEKSLSIADQPNKRISQVEIYYALRNPLQSVDEPDNYQSAALVVDLVNASDYGSAAIKRIYSRWIPAGGRAVATRIGNIQKGRFAQPPRKFGLNLFRYGEITPVIGAGYQVNAWPLQDDTGARADVPAQITSLDPQADKYVLELEEFNFDFDDEGGDPTIIFEIDAFEVNARTTFDLFYSPPTSGDDVYIYISEGVTIGSHDAGTPAFDVGSWPAGVNVYVINQGTIQGRGGDGGQWAIAGSNAGGDGGVALYTRNDIDLDNSAGSIIGGGGGGGSGGGNGFGTIGLSGGGGAGTDPGEGGPGEESIPIPAADDGTATSGGAGASDDFHNNGGAGGGPGSAGSSGVSGASGGAAGAAIDGDSYITHSGSGTITGPQVN